MTYNPKGMCSKPYDLFKFWEINDISEMVQERERYIVAMEH